MGLLGSIFGGKKTAGSDSGNALQFSNADEASNAQKQIDNLLHYKADPNIVDPIKGTRTATNEIQNNSILGQLFGKNGTLSNTVKDEADLAGRGYSLKPEDYEAYGQGSDNIARMFGNSDANLAQALSNRGLSGSAGAGMAFAGAQGNKMEHLGQLQRQISNDRMNSNMQRLGQTRNFLSNLSGQASQDINQQNARQMGAEQSNFNELMQKNNAAQSRLQAMQNQSNEQMSQRAQTQETPGWVQGLSGAEDYFQNTGAKLLSAISGNPSSLATSSGGGLSGAQPKQMPATKFGQSNNYGVA